eukprot:gnl/TRDRNA2_/TRDRNA2_180437_c0_seq1.p1 gnl/TRDRNA2_/TRDRNA2_180437_c0~~gnl/TRDRNA2_/TRDRNA2_180437_c0_seq1.p1  ORF type:complete len:260 (+),score=107.62 gnl/TRDRNA2_/TRDRNA2_180437_c0_seq1:69-848(+)
MTNLKMLSVTLMLLHFAVYGLPMEPEDRDDVAMVQLRTQWNKGEKAAEKKAADQKAVKGNEKANAKAAAKKGDESQNTVSAQKTGPADGVRSITAEMIKNKDWNDTYEKMEEAAEKAMYEKEKKAVAASKKMREKVAAEDRESRRVQQMKDDKLVAEEFDRAQNKADKKMREDLKQKRLHEEQLEEEDSEDLAMQRMAEHRKSKVMTLMAAETKNLNAASGTKTDAVVKTGTEAKPAADMKDTLPSVLGRTDLLKPESA